MGKGATLAGRAMTVSRHSIRKVVRSVTFSCFELALSVRPENRCLTGQSRTARRHLTVWVLEPGLCRRLIGGA